MMLGIFGRHVRKGKQTKRARKLKKMGKYEAIRSYTAQNRGILGI
jgi:hypothetical protein